MAIITYTSKDGNKVAQFSYDMTVRSKYNVIDHYIDMVRAQWQYIVRIKTGYHYIKHLTDDNKPDFTPDGLLFWEEEDGKTYFINSRSGRVEKLGRRQT